MVLHLKKAITMNNIKKKSYSLVIENRGIYLNRYDIINKIVNNEIYKHGLDKFWIIETAYISNRRLWF